MLVPVTLGRTISFGGGGNSFGSEADFAFEEILYYSFQVTIQSWTCQRIGGGAYGTGAYGTIAAFLQDLQAGTLKPTTGALPNSGGSDGPFDIVVRRPCFVVVRLSSDDDSTLCFQNDPLQTQDPHQQDYRGLNPAYTDADGRTRVIYFAVPAPRPSGDDSYNLYVQYGDGAASHPIAVHTIDPKIKNRG